MNKRMLKNTLRITLYFVILYIGCSIWISYSIDRMIKRNIGAIKHQYVEDNEYNDYLIPILDPTAKPAPTQGGLTYYNYKMSFPITFICFDGIVCRYNYTHELFEQQKNGDYELIQASYNRHVEIVIKMKNGRFTITDVDGDGIVGQVEEE